MDVRAVQTAPGSVQQVRHLGVAVGEGVVEGGAVVLVDEGGVGAVLQQHLHQTKYPAIGGVVQGSSPALVTSITG